MEDGPCAGIQVRVTTITGSITGTPMTLPVEGSLTVHEFKLLVQGQAEDTRLDQREVSLEFQRVFLGDRELTDDDITLDECGVNKDSTFFFAVGKTLGNKLRSAVRCVQEDFSEHGDCEILAKVLENLKGRIRRQDRSTLLIDELCLNVFNTKFHNFKGVHSGFLTLEKADGGESDYIQWVVFEKVEGAFPFKTTYYGIPVYTRLHRRKKQHLIGAAQPHSLIVHQQAHDEVGAPGYFGPEGQRMVCTAHFAKRVGTHVFKNANDDHPVGQTTISNGVEDIAVVEMNVPCATTGQITTNFPQIGGQISRAATFQTGAIQNAVITLVNPETIIAAEPLPATSKKGDSNAPWSTPNGRTVGIHSSGDPDDGTMSVVRLDTNRRRRMAQPAERRSKRRATGSCDGELETKMRKRKPDGGKA